MSRDVAPVVRTLTQGRVNAYGMYENGVLTLSGVRRTRNGDVHRVRLHCGG